MLLTEQTNEVGGGRHCNCHELSIRQLEKKSQIHKWFSACAKTSHRNTQTDQTTYRMLMAAQTQAQS